MDRSNQKQIESNQFYTLLNDFMDDLISVFPDQKSRIEKYKLLTKTMRAMDYMTPITLFYTYVSPYEEQITHCDENYFLKKNMDEIVDDQETLVEGLELKKLWIREDTTPDTKAAIWAYMQELLKQSAKTMLSNLK